MRTINKLYILIHYIRLVAEIMPNGLLNRDSSVNPSASAQDNCLVPSFGGVVRSFSWLLSLHTWLSQGSHKIDFIASFDLFWELAALFKWDGLQILVNVLPKSCWLIFRSHSSQLHVYDYLQNNHQLQPPCPVPSHDTGSICTANLGIHFLAHQFLSSQTTGQIKMFINLQ